MAKVLSAEVAYTKEFIEATPSTSIDDIARKDLSIRLAKQLEAVIPINTERQDFIQSQRYTSTVVLMNMDEYLYAKNMLIKYNARVELENGDIIRLSDLL